VDRFGGWRNLASRIVARVGGLPAARTLIAVLAVFDRSGGGLVAGGLAYATLFALLPGLLLVLSVFGLLAGDVATRDRLARSIEEVLPPLSGIVRAALDQVSTGAVPTGIIAVVALLWGSSRFYSVLDRAFAQIFDDAPRRSEVERTIRGVVLTVLIVGLPVSVLIVNAVVAWVLDLAPDGVRLGAAARTALRLGAPLVLAVLSVAMTGLVYRFVPTRRVPLVAVRRPAVVAGLVLAGFT
jgi:membrane protein